MSIQINNGTECQPITIHSIPTKLHADDDTDVTKFFYNLNKNEETPTASFRGYSLKGENIPLPKGYTGLILHESISPTAENNDRNWYVVDKFNSVQYWNWDKLPSKNDEYMEASTWHEIAEALHSPVCEDQFKKPHQQ